MTTATAKGRKKDETPQNTVTLSAVVAQRRSTPKQSRYRDVPAVSHALAVLRLLGTSDVPLGVNAIAARLDAVPSTILHILRVLVREELVCFDPDSKQYALDAGILTIARSVLRPSSFGHRIQDPLDMIAEEYRVTTLAVRVVGLDHIIVVAKTSSNRMLQLHVEVGSRFPALMSATGRCVAAFQPSSRENIQQRFAQIRWDSPPSFAEWTTEVADAKQNRFSVDNGNYLAGVLVVAAPVLDRHQHITHAVVAVGLNEQIKTRVRAALCRDVKALAQRFSED